MPKIEVYKDDLERLVRKKFDDLDELEEALMFAKTELEKVDKEGRIKLDVKDTNRPDLWSVEGIARELRGALGTESGRIKYKVSSSDIELKIEPSVISIRPVMLSAVVRDLKFDNRLIEQIIQLQEKLALTYGRKRREAAIGIYDFDSIVPPLRYTAFSDKQIKFIPLGSEREMSPKDILRNHPKGREYAHLLPSDKFPILIDSKGNVCSMPPVINSEWAGKITNNTRNVFVECTGWNTSIVSTALTVVVTALAERGGKIQSVRVITPKRKIFDTPIFNEQSISLDANKTRQILGVDISNEQIINLLKRARYDAKISKDIIIAKIPPYRSDVMHWRDVVEDVAIMFGYNKIKPENPKIYSTGSSLPLEDFSELFRDISVGSGLQEVMTFILTSKENLTSKMMLEGPYFVEIANPISTLWNVMRSWLTPNILEFLAKNKHSEYPQRIFEIGDCIVIDEKAETKTKDTRKICVALSDTRIGYENAASIMDGMMRNFGFKYYLKPLSKKYYITGRSAEVFIDNISIGEIGEIHPQVLNNFNLEKAVVIFELDVSKIWEIISKRKKR